MQPLTNILEHLEVEYADGPLNGFVSAIHMDSRKVGLDALFVAVKGTQVDGHDFIPQALEKGASVIVAEQLPTNRPQGVTFIKVSNSSRALGYLASAFYDHPSRQLKVVAITGTNGKTTTVNLLYDLFVALGYKVGMLSTLGNRIAGEWRPAMHTTPDAIALQESLREMVEAGCTYAFMEASSHAIHQERIAGLHLEGALFSNISHDHLDYHKTFKAYIDAKKKLFDELPKSAFALVNLDDRRGTVMLQNTQARPFTYALRVKADFKAKILENTLEGLHLELDGVDFYSQLIGRFNAYNLLVVYGTAILLEQDKMEVLQALSGLKAAAGRFETIIDKERSIIGIVDYAHTPDALENVLQTINDLKAGVGRVLTLVGCGGDRDRAKRPIMARMATEYSDLVLLTSDNPRTEDPELILNEMEAGVPITAQQKVLRITNRRSAIQAACQMAKKGDVILVAGKGHEKYQEINGERLPFDDVVELKKGLGISMTVEK